MLSWYKELEDQKKECQSRGLNFILLHEDVHTTVTIDVCVPFKTVCSSRVDKCVKNRKGLGRAERKNKEG